MTKQLKDYLHLYLNSEIFCLTPNGKGKLITLGMLGLFGFGMSPGYKEFEAKEVKPILRRLSSMTEEELKECGNMVYDFSDDPELNNHHWKEFEIGLAPEQFHWLLKKGFDLFNLIDEGLAIDAATLETVNAK